MNGVAVIGHGFFVLYSDLRLKKTPKGQHHNLLLQIRQHSSTLDHLLLSPFSLARSPTLARIDSTATATTAMWLLVVATVIKAGSRGSINFWREKRSRNKRKKTNNPPISVISFTLRFFWRESPTATPIPAGFSLDGSLPPSLSASSLSRSFSLSVSRFPWCRKTQKLNSDLGFAVFWFLSGINGYLSLSLSRSLYLVLILLKGKSNLFNFV